MALTSLNQGDLLLDKEHKGNKTLFRRIGKRNIAAFIGQNSHGFYYAFGAPSQTGGYIAFNVADYKTAYEKICANLFPVQFTD